MVRSMTGFGKAQAAYESDEVSAEISSVNHRYLDCSVRMPSSWSSLEHDVKQAVRERLSRGKVTVTINRRRAGQTKKTLQFDETLARQYIAAGDALSQTLGTGETMSLNVLARLDGVFFFEEPEEDLERARTALVNVVKDALDHLESMRSNEGSALADELRSRIEGMEALLTGIEDQLPRIQQEHAARLKTRVGELNLEPNVSEERLAVEIALLAEKADVTEEAVRLKSHFRHALDLMANPEPMGRKLDFLAQEMGREINTLGVKTRDSGVARDILELKSELEKIREQVQNVE